MEGKVFDGWYDSDGKLVTPDYVFTKNTKLTARYMDDRVVVDGIDYLLTENDAGDTVAVVKGFADGGFRKDLVIPGKITVGNGREFQVYEVYTQAFARLDIETVVISDGVVVVDEASFNMCTKLKSITVGKDVQFMHGAFVVVECDHDTMKVET